jgi:Fe-S cluster assembly ATP-binding protein
LTPLLREGHAAETILACAEEEQADLIITHHEQLLEHNRPDFTHVIVDGRIVQTGGPELAADLHKHGYDRLRALEAL